MVLLWVDLLTQPKRAPWLGTEAKATWLSPPQRLFILEVVTGQFPSQDRVSLGQVP